MYHVNVSTDDQTQRAPQQSQALCMLETYLETDSAPTPVFSLPRSRDVDQLLCRWAFEKADVDRRLLEALEAVPLISTPAEVAVLAKGWAASAAALVHPVRGLQARINAYLHVLQAAGRQNADDSNDYDEEIDVDGDDVPLYVVIHAGIRSRSAADGGVPEALGDVVHDMEPEEQVSALGLEVAGTLLSGGALGLGDDDEGNGGTEKP